MSEDDFILNFLSKSRRLKNHNLPYGIEYLNFISKIEEESRKKWRKNLNKYHKRI